MEILKLKNMLESERKTNQRRVEDACEVAKTGLEGMVAQFGSLHPDIVRMVHAQLLQASNVATQRTIDDIRNSEFYSQRIQELIDIAKVSAPKL